MAHSHTQTDIDDAQITETYTVSRDYGDRWHFRGSGEAVEVYRPITITWETDEGVDKIEETEQVARVEPRGDVYRFQVISEGHTTISQEYEDYSDATACLEVFLANH